MSKLSSTFSDEFKKLHDESDYSNDNVHTELEESDMRLFESTQETKKEKKARKKKEKKERRYGDKLSLIMGDISLQFDDDDETKNIDDSFGLDDDELYLISKKPKKGKKRELFDIKQAKKAKKRNIEAKFAPQITILNKILKDTTTTAADIRGVVDGILKSKARYTGKGLTDLLQALNTANSNRASVVRDISNIQKTIIDLNLKMDKANPKKDDKSTDNEEYGISLFRNMLSGGSNRKELLDAAAAHYSTQNDVYYDDGIEEDADAAISARLNTDENKFRTDEGNSYIKYENLEPRDVIVYHSDGTWEPDAIDKDGNSMPSDYPRLTHRDIGDNPKFELDQGICLDSFGRTHKLIQAD